MKIETFHTEIARLAAKLSPAIVLTGELFESPRYGGVDQPMDLEELTQITASTFKENWNAGAPWWPTADPAFYLARCDRYQLRFTGDDGTHYQREPAISVAVPLGECGLFVMHFDRWWCHSPQLTAWTFISTFDDAQTNYSAGYAVHIDEKRQPLGNITKAVAGNPSIFEGTTELIISVLEDKIEKLISSPHTQRTLLNQAHAEGLEKFEKLLNGWWMLPWISVNEDTERMEPIDNPALHWHKQGPFDQIALILSDEAGKIVTSMSAILLHREKVVKFFKFDPVTGASLNIVPEDAKNFWGELERLTLQARRLLSTEL